MCGCTHHLNSHGARALRLAVSPQFEIYQREVAVHGRREAAVVRVGGAAGTKTTPFECALSETTV
jgi:hypothetical protein